VKKLYAAKKILTALEARDSSALEQIEKDFGKLMTNIARNLGLGRDDTEECINDTLLEIWNTIPPAHPESIRSYACMLMRRRSIDKIRHNTAGKRGKSVYFDLVQEMSDWIDVETAVIDSLCIPELLNQFLASQSAENREIFIRRFFEFESISSIAADLFLTVRTVEKRLSRMRQKLKEILSGGGYDRV